MQSVTVDRDVETEMRDGTILRADIYKPANDDSYPTLVYRIPYNKSDAQVVGGLMMNPLEAAERGYAVVVQDCRGRYNSDGEWAPFQNEKEDGYDTVEWAASQSWSNGKVGVYGSSYAGFTTQKAVAANPPHLEAALPYITGNNYHDNGIYFNGQALNLGMAFWWPTYLLGFDTANRLANKGKDMKKAKKALAETTIDPWEKITHLPVEDIPTFQHGATDYWQDWMDNPQYEGFWEEIDLTNEVENFDVPILHIAGWYDYHLRGQLEMYNLIKEKGGDHAKSNQYLIVGPWPHEAYMSPAPTKAGDLEFGVTAPAGRFFVERHVFNWFDYWLKDGTGNTDGFPNVRYFTINENEWANIDDWPPNYKEENYYLHSNGNANTRFGDGKLVPNKQTNGVSDSYIYNPENPVPTEGGSVVMPTLVHDGMQDQSEVEERDDVLVYSSPKLADSKTVTGPIDVTIYATTSAPDTDFTAKLVDVKPDGYAGIITDGIVRAQNSNAVEDGSSLSPESVYEFNIDLGATAYTFETGHRIRVEISSSNFPKHDRNLNTDKPAAKETRDDLQTATQVIYHNEEYPSRITLPFVGE